MDSPTKRKKKQVNVRLQLPSDIHDNITLHQKHLNRKSEYVVSQEEAHIDLLRKASALLPHLNK
jgi:hypothetical protein